MTFYYRAGAPIPLGDAGTVEFASDEGNLRDALEEAIAEASGPDRRDGAVSLSMSYGEPKDYLRLMSKLQNRLNGEEAGRVRCRISEEAPEEERAERKDDGADGWLPLAELFEDVGGISVPDYILHRHYTLFLQPIVRADGNIEGYEFLTRPMPEQMPFRPAELFAKARKIGQHAFLDKAARQAAIRMGAAHLDPGTIRFVNFLPSSLRRPDVCLRCTFDEMKATGTDPADCVFEVSESEPLDDPALPGVFEAYRRHGARLALDDVGSGFATLDVVERLRPDYVKMDRRWVGGCEADPAKQRYIDRLLERVSRFRGVVLAEGVERPEERDYLIRAGVPLFQGYLFGRARPVPLASPVAAR